MFLQEMKGHEHIVSLTNVLKADNDRDIYLIFEYMETDLHAAIRANILQDIHKQYILWQTLKALKYMHSANLVHRDMKPSNLLLNSDCLMKVADFGLARSLKELQEQATSNSVLTDYVATRWYRAPEILLGSTRYDYSVDMWAVGCILGEMIYGKPIFPGQSTINQLEKILELTGMPSAKTIQSLGSQYAERMIDQTHGIGFAHSEAADVYASFKRTFSAATDDALDPHSPSQAGPKRTDYRGGGPQTSIRAAVSRSCRGARGAPFTSSFPSRTTTRNRRPCTARGCTTR